MPEAARELGRAEKAAGGFGSTLGKIATGAVIGGVGALAVGLGGVVKVAADFEQSLTGVAAATGATKDQMAAMRKEALGIGADTSKSASEAVLAMGELTKAGVSVEDAVGGVARTVVQLAEATAIDMPEAANLVTNAMTTFKREGLSASDAANALAKAANASAIDVSDMGQSLSAVGPVAAASGMTMKDFATAIGIMGNNAIRGSDAGTSLKALLAGLTPSSKEAAKAMQSLGINAFDAQGNFKSFRDIVGNLQQAFGPLNEQQRATYGEMIFGSDAVRALNILLKEGVTGWDAFGNAMEQADSVEEQSRKRRESFLAQLEALKGSLETIAIEVGSLFLPALTSMTAFLAENVGPAFNTAREVIAGFITLLSTGQTFPLFQALETFLGRDLANEISLKLGSIVETIRPIVADINAVLSGIGAGITDNLPQIVDAIAKAFEDARPRVQAVLDEIRGSNQSTAEDVKNQWPGVQPAIVNAFETARGDVTRIMGEIDAEVKRVSASIQAEWPNIGTAAEVTFTAIAVAAQGIIPGVVPTFQQIFESWDSVLANMNAAAVRQWNGIVIVIQGALQTVHDLLTPVIALFQSWARVMSGDVVGGAQAVGGAISGLMTILGNANPAIALLRDLLSAAAGFARDLASGIGSVAGAAAGALNPLGGVLDLLGKIGGAKGALDFVLPGSLPPLAQGFKDVGEQATIASSGVGDLAYSMGELGGGQFQTNILDTFARSIAALADNANNLRAAQATLRDLTADLRALKLELQLDPNNATLKEQYEGLAFTVQVHKDLVATLKESVAAWNAETFAVDGFVMALDTLNQSGPQALKIQEAFVKALSENDMQAGTALAQSLQKMVADATKALSDSPDLLAPIQTLGDSVMAAFRTALEAPSEETINAAMAILTQLSDAINAATIAQTERLAAAGTLTAETFKTGLVNSLNSEQFRSEVGAAGVSLLDALNVALETGGVKNIEKLTDLTARMVESVQTLPEQFQALAPELQAALEAFINEPTEAAHARLIEAISDINEATTLIPKNFQQLAPAMQNAVRLLVQQVDNGALPLSQAVQRWKQITDLIPNNMAELTPAIQAEIYAIIQAFLEMAISGEEMAARIEAVMKRVAATTEAAANATAAAANVVARSVNGVLTVLKAGGGGGGGGDLGDKLRNLSDEAYAAALHAIAMAYHNQGIVLVPGLGFVKPVREPDGSITYEPAPSPIATGAFVRESSAGTIARIAEGGTGGEWVLRNDQLTAIIRQAVTGVSATFLDQFRGMAAARLMRSRTSGGFSDLGSPIAHTGAFGSNDSGSGTGGAWQPLDYEQMADAFVRALRHQPITASIDGEQIDRRADRQLRSTMR